MKQKILLKQNLTKWMKYRLSFDIWHFTMVPIIQFLRYIFLYHKNSAVVWSNLLNPFTSIIGYIWINTYTTWLRSSDSPHSYQRVSLYCNLQEYPHDLEITLYLHTYCQMYATPWNPDVYILSWLISLWTLPLTVCVLSCFYGSIGELHVLHML